MQPRLGRRREARAPTPRAGVNRVVVRRAVDAAARARRARAHARPRQRRARGRRRPRRRLRARQPRPHLRHAGRVASTTGGATLDGALALEPGPRERVRADRRAGHAARQAVAAGERPRPTTTTRPTSTSSPTTASPPPGSSGTRSRTGPGRARSAATTSSTGSGGDYLAIGCAAHGHTGGRRVVERAHARALHRAAVARRDPPRPGDEILDRRPSARPRRSSWPSAPRPGSSSPLPTADPARVDSCARRARRRRSRGPTADAARTGRAHPTRPAPRPTR